MAPRKKETPRRSGPQTAIGIDFGTSKCCVGLVRNGKVEILENERGSKTTPSYVAFTEAERLVGESALDQVALNPINTVFEAKRLLGRKGEGTTWGLERHLPFDVTQEKCGVRIKVTYKGKERRLSPEQIAAMMLSQMKQLAEKHLGSPVLNAVIAVPAHFNNAQRKAIKDAGTIAGLSVLGLISESAAAVLAYQDGKTLAKKQNVLLVDSGGGAFNAAVVEVQDASVKVKAICGTPELSGGGMDQFLVDHLAESFTKRNNVDLKGNEKALERLRLACQKAKHTLTLLPETVVRVDCLVGNEDCSDTVTRAEFIGKFLPAAQETIKNVLNSVLCDAKLTPPDVDEVVLIGGTTRVPAVQEELVKFFGGKALNKTVNPDEAVAHGAALQAAILAGDNTLSEVRVADIVKNPVDYPEHLKKRLGAPLETVPVPPVGEVFDIYHERIGRKNKKVNHVVDSFGVYHPRGNDQHIKNLQTCHVDVMKVNSYLSEKEIRQMRAEVEWFVNEDEKYNRLLTAQTDLEALCFKVQGKLLPLAASEKVDASANVPDRTKALKYCEACMEWMEKNERAPLHDYQDRTKKLKGLLSAAETEMKRNSIIIPEEAQKCIENNALDISSTMLGLVPSNVPNSDHQGTLTGDAKKVLVIEAKNSHPLNNGTVEQPVNDSMANNDINEGYVFGNADNSLQASNLQEKTNTVMNATAFLSDSKAVPSSSTTEEITANTAPDPVLDDLTDSLAGLSLDGETRKAVRESSLRQQQAPPSERTHTAQNETFTPQQQSSLIEKTRADEDETFSPRQQSCEGTSDLEDTKLDESNNLIENSPLTTSPLNNNLEILAAERDPFMSVILQCQCIDGETDEISLEKNDKSSATSVTLEDNICIEEMTGGKGEHQEQIVLGQSSREANEQKQTQDDQQTQEANGQKQTQDDQQTQEANGQEQTQDDQQTQEANGQKQTQNDQQTQEANEQEQTQDDQQTQEANGQKQTQDDQQTQEANGQKQTQDDQQTQVANGQKQTQDEQQSQEAIEQKQTQNDQQTQEANGQKQTQDDQQTQEANGQKQTQDDQQTQEANGQKQTQDDQQTQEANGQKQTQDDQQTQEAKGQKQTQDDQQTQEANGQKQTQDDQQTQEANGQKQTQNEQQSQEAIEQKQTQNDLEANGYKQTQDDQPSLEVDGQKQTQHDQQSLDANGQQQTQHDQQSPEANGQKQTQHDQQCLEANGQKQTQHDQPSLEANGQQQTQHYRQSLEDDGQIQTPHDRQSQMTNGQHKQMQTEPFEMEPSHCTSDPDMSSQNSDQCATDNGNLDTHPNNVPQNYEPHGAGADMATFNGPQEDVLRQDVANYGGHSDPRPPAHQTGDPHPLMGGGPQGSHNRVLPSDETRNRHQSRVFSSSQGRGRGMGRDRRSDRTPYPGNISHQNYSRKSSATQWVTNVLTDELCYFWINIYARCQTFDIDRFCFYCDLGLRDIEQCLVARSWFLYNLRRHPPWCPGHRSDLNRHWKAIHNW